MRGRGVKLWRGGRDYLDIAEYKARGSDGGIMGDERLEC
jgi:hypothetical protein